MRKKRVFLPVAIKLIVMYWMFLVVVVLFSSCSAPKQRRGDWMEHLNHRQFRFNAPTVAWDRRNYYSMDELKEIWAITYERALANLDTE